MSRRTMKDIENPRGTGEVHLNGQCIATVVYNIRVRQEYIAVSTFGGTDEIRGVKDIAAHLKVIDGDRDLLGKEGLTLHLQDGRVWSFIVTRGDFLRGEWTALNSGGGETTL